MCSEPIRGWRASNSGDWRRVNLCKIDRELDCLLSRQEYTLAVATQYSNGLSQDWLDDVPDFQVVDSKDVAGMLNLNTRVRDRKLAALASVEGTSGIP